MSSLLDYLGKDRTSEFTGYYGMASTAGLGHTDEAGRTAVYTAADLDRAATIEDKLKVATELAGVARFRAETGMRVGRADAAASVAAEMAQVLDTVFGALNAQRTTGTPVDTNKIDPKLDPYKAQVDTMLGVMAEAGATLNALSGGLRDEKRAAFTDAMKMFDGRAVDVAALVKSQWSRQAPATGFRPDPTKLVDIMV